MFGRRSSRDGDVVAAARRRLEALAVQHAADRRPADVAAEPGATAPIERDLPAPPTPLSQQRTPSAARHLGERRSELGRWGITGQHVTVVALCLLLLVVVVAWWALRSVPHAEQVSLTTHRQVPDAVASDIQPSTSPVPSDQGGTTGVVIDSGTESSGPLVVDVAGKVRHPGIVELAQGARVVDAI